MCLHIVGRNHVQLWYGKFSLGTRIFASYRALLDTVCDFFHMLIKITPFLLRCCILLSDGIELWE